LNIPKYILITGASSGIGFDACRYLIQKGFHVIGTVRSAEDKVRLEKQFTEGFEAVILDVCLKEDIQNLAKYLSEKLQDTGLFGLINNAGVAIGGPLMLISDAEFEKQMEPNLMGIFRLTNALLPLLGARSDSPYPPGRIINISSVSGLVNSPIMGPYCISKHGLESMSDIYRIELSLYGLKVILIEPGPIQTPIWNKSVPRENPYEGTDFSGLYDIFIKRVEKSMAGALPVETVSRVIHHALTVKAPRQRYLISRTKLMVWLVAKVIPGKWLDRIYTANLKKLTKSHV